MNLHVFMGLQKKKDKKEYEGDGEGFVSLNISAHAKRSIAAIFLFVIAAIFFLGFFGAAGVLGNKLDNGVGLIFGGGKYIAPFVFAFAGYILLRTKVETGFYVTKIVGVSLAFWGFLALLHIAYASVVSEEFSVVAQMGKGGGYLGYILGGSLVKFTGGIAGSIILIAIIVIGLIVAFNMSFVGVGDRIPSMKKEGGFFRKKVVSDDEEENNDDEVVAEDEDVEDETDFDDTDFDDEESDDEVAEEVESIKTPREITEEKAQEIIDSKDVDHSRTGFDTDLKWELPPLRLLKKGGDKATGGDVKQRAVRIQETFENFGISMELEDVVTGPTVTQYSFHPQSGVKLSRITALNADLALALAAHPIRIEAPIPGKSLVGIEVPNKTRATVRMRDLLNTDEFEQSEKKLLLALGEDVNGDYVMEDLSKMPHLLVAGTTGSGKSVTINCILLSLLYKNSPDDLKLILVDPKRVELTLYAGIPHLLSDVIVDNGKVLNALKWSVGEMERRYKLLQETGSRDLASYNEKRKSGGLRSFVDPDTGQTIEEEMERLPAIVIVIDELSDLMSSHGKEVEGVIVRIAQMSRAIGIHLIISTQRPSVEVITGLIKANLPTRIALRVATNIDSRTIIDVPGAEKLIGNGDMLFVGPQSSSPHRLQSAFVDEDELKKVVNFIKRQAESVGAYGIDQDFSLESPAENSTGDGGNNGNRSNESDDVMYDEAKELVITNGKASTSYMQRRLRIGYSRAARIMDELEDNGIIGPADGSKARKVLVSADTDVFDEEDEVENDV